MATWLSALRAQFKDVLRRIERVEDKTDDHATRIAKLEANSDSHKQWLNDLESKVDGPEPTPQPVPQADAGPKNPLSIPLGIFLARLLFGALTVVGTAAITYAIYQAVKGAEMAQESSP